MLFIHRLCTRQSMCFLCSACSTACLELLEREREILLIYTEIWFQRCDVILILYGSVQLFVLLLLLLLVRCKEDILFLGQGLSIKKTLSCSFDPFMSLLKEFQSHLYMLTAIDWSSNGCQYIESDEYHTMGKTLSWILTWLLGPLLLIDMCLLQRDCDG